MVERIEVYLTSQQIAERVAAIGAAIEQAPAGDDPLVMVCVLQGSFAFYADLLREIRRPVHTAFLAVSSYEGGTSTTGAVRLTHDLTIDVKDRHVILVEDIVDTGLTMSYLLDLLSARRPASIRVATLLHKPARRRVDVPLEWVGFVIEDAFVVGYGLDYENRYRNLPYIGTMHFDAPSGAHAPADADPRS